MSKRGGPDTYTTYTAPVISPGGPTDDCADLEFPADLKRPQQPALSKVNEGDALKIRLDAVNTPWMYNFDDEQCGVIVSLQSTKLVECLKKGKAFTAAVLKLKGDVCSVLVQPAKK